MAYIGVDTASKISSVQAKALAEANISFVGRYLVNPTWGKALTDDEAKRLLNAGLGILLIWETTASRARDGADAGKQDGYSAYSFARQIGVPDGCTIYYAVDYNAPKTDYPLIEQYLYAAKSACVPYRCGVYGKADLVNSVKADAYMQCVAWSDGLVSAKANIYQYEWQGGKTAQEIAKKIGVFVDMNSCGDLERAGIWMPPKQKPWYEDAMNYVSQHGYMTDGRPNDNVTRAELATVIMRVCESNKM